MRKVKKKNKRKIFDMGKSETIWVTCTRTGCNGRWNKKASINCPLCGKAHGVKDGTIKDGTIKEKKVNIPDNSINNMWEVKIDCVDQCSKAPESKTIYIKPLVKVKIEFLMKKLPNIEWLAYLIGENDIIDDLFIPEQSVSPTRVDKIICPEWNNLKCIGVIHSHHGMGNEFSGTDHDWINQNHNLSLVISHSGIKGQLRWKTPCDSIKIIPVNVKLKIESDFDKQEFITTINKKIKKEVFTSNFYEYGVSNYKNGSLYKEPLNKSQMLYVNGVPVTKNEYSKYVSNNLEENDNLEEDDNWNSNSLEKTLIDELDEIETKENKNELI